SPDCENFLLTKCDSSITEFSSLDLTLKYAYGAQKKVSDPERLELQAVVCSHVPEQPEWKSLCSLQHCALSFEPFSPIFAEELKKRATLIRFRVSQATLIRFRVSQATVIRVRVSQATLIRFRVSQATLIRVRVSQATLIRVRVSQATLIRFRVSQAYRVHTPVTEFIECDILVHELEQDYENQATIYIAELGFESGFFMEPTPAGSFP
ncbi:hypothetical protein STEG23_023121, partial [Scotinomys teguina]